MPLPSVPSTAAGRPHRRQDLRDPARARGLAVGAGDADLESAPRRMPVGGRSAILGEATLAAPDGGVPPPASPRPLRAPPAPRALRMRLARSPGPISGARPHDRRGTRRTRRRAPRGGCRRRAAMASRSPAATHRRSPGRACPRPCGGARNRTGRKGARDVGVALRARAACRQPRAHRQTLRQRRARCSPSGRPFGLTSPPPLRAARPAGSRRRTARRTAPQRAQRGADDGGEHRRGDGAAVVLAVGSSIITATRSRGLLTGAKPT